MDTDDALDPVQVLTAYEAACQRFDVEAATAFFAEEGALEFAGGQVTGRAALLEAHRWDGAARNRVAFVEPRVSGDEVAVTMVNQHELHRILGVEAIRRAAEMVIRDGRIYRLRIGVPEPGSMQAMREKAGPFFAWVREQHAEAWERTAVLDEAGGQALYDLAHEWQRHMAAMHKAGT
jgi:hypothetical protein